MDVNERIARALGWKQCEKTNCLLAPRHHWTRRTLPDYAHSLDACLPVLAGLREKGWRWGMSQLDTEVLCAIYRDAVEDGEEREQRRVARADSPAAALAECLADALEAK